MDGLASDWILALSCFVDARPDFCPAVPPATFADRKALLSLSVFVPRLSLSNFLRWPQIAFWSGLDLSRATAFSYIPHRDSQFR